MGSLNNVHIKTEEGNLRKQFMMSFQFSDTLRTGKCGKKVKRQWLWSALGVEGMNI